jgi:hypothetical protein
MVESKSGYFTNDFNAHSEKSVGFSLKGINRLADDSERRFTFAHRVPQVTQKWPLVRFGLSPHPGLAQSGNNESPTG